MKTKFVSIMMRAICAVALAASLCSCSIYRAYRSVSLTSVDVGSAVPSLSGERAMDIVLKVGVDNPAGRFKVDDISGAVYMDGTRIASVTGGPMKVARGGVQVCDLPCTLLLEDNVSIFSLMMMFGRNGTGGLTADISGYAIHPLGLRKKIERKGLKVMDMVKKYR